MALTGEQRRKLHDAVVDAINDQPELARLVRHGMNVRLSQVVGSGGLDEVVFELLDWLETQGRVGEFIRVMREARPYHEQLRKTLDEIEGVETPPPPLPSPDAELNFVTRIKERLKHGSLVYIVLSILVLAVSGSLIAWLLGFGKGTISRNVNTNTTTNLNANVDGGKGGRGTAERLPVQESSVWNNGFVMKGKYIAYASPDDTYSIIKERIDSARDSILVGIYDFKAIYIKDLLLAAIGRGVKKVTLLIGRGGAAQQAIVDELTRNGAKVTIGKSGFLPPFAVYHSKVIVIDGLWTLVQTANFTETAVPLPKDPGSRQKGNRETGIALESAELAGYFTRLLERDLQLIQNAENDRTRAPSERPDRVYEPNIDVPRFSALRGDASGRNQDTGKTARPVDTTGMRVLPVTSPDNYLEVLTQVLASARESIEIYQQYIRPKSDNVRKLLDAIKAAQENNPNLTVRIILAKPFQAAREEENWNILRGDYGWKFGDNLRILNPGSGLNSTNKLVIIDKRVSLVGSANWSDLGVTKNREACVLIDSGEIANWYVQLFEFDWKVGLQFENITDHE